MTFNWSNIEIGFDVVSMRYINDMIWFHYSILGIIPLWYVCIERFYFFLFNKERHKNIKNEHLKNAILKILTVWAPCYYFLDGFVSLLEGTAFSLCRFPYFYHHIIAVIIQPFLLTREALNWTDLLVCATHAIFVKYPLSQFCCYLYVCAIFTFNIGLYFIENWKSKFAGKYFPFIYYSFILIAFSDNCDSSLPYLAE